MADAQGKFVAAAVPFFDDLPRGWAKATLGEVGNWSSGGTPSRKVPTYFGGSIPWAKIGDMQDRPLRETEEFITEEGLASSSAKIVPADTLLLAMYGASIGKLGIAAIPCATNQAIACGQLHRSITTPEYVFKYLLYSRHRLIELGQGGAQPNISQGIVKAFPILIPPLAEQRRMVSRIDELFSRIEAGERAIAAARAGLKRYRKSTLKAAVTGPLTADWRKERSGSVDGVCNTPMDWSTATGADFFVWSSGKFLPKKNMRPGPYRVYGGNGVNGQHDDFNVELEALVIGRVGVHCGNVHRSTGPSWITDNAIYASEVRPGIVLGFAELCFRQADLKQEAQGGAQPFVNQKALNEIQFRLPPLDEQAEIVSRVEAALSRADHADAMLDAQIRNARALKQSILKAAFEGRLVPQDPHDEPATDMLARIAGEPSATKTKTKARA